MWEHSIGGKADVGAMIKLSEDNYGLNSGMSSKELIIYQYFDNPCGEAYIDVAVDKDNGKLAEQYIVIPTEFYVGGKKCPCVLSMNTLTDKEYRGLGIFTGLVEVTYKRCAEEGRMFCNGSPNANSYHGF